MGIFSKLLSLRSSSSSKASSSPTKDNNKAIDPLASASDTITVTSRSSHTTSSGKSSKSKKSTRSSRSSSVRSSASAKPIPSLIVEEQFEDPKLAVAKALIANYNDPNCTPEQFASIWVCDTKNRYIFEDGLSFKPGDMAGMIQMVRQSFPDFYMKHESIAVQGTNKVTIEGAYCGGTHTGVPYAPAPVFPPIEADNVAVRNDEERFWLELENCAGDGEESNWKIKTCKCFSMGDKSGPVGFYEQIGGSPTPPPPPAESSA